MIESGSKMTALSDRPDEADKLDFEPYATTIYDIITNSTETPLTIGIFGSWGSGKTSLMHMIRSRLLNSASGRQDLVIWFNAWLYSKEDALWRALITRVLSEVRVIHSTEPEDSPIFADLNNLSTQLYRTTSTAELGSLSIVADNLLSEEGTGAAQISLTLHRALELLERVGIAREAGKLAAMHALQSEVRQAVTQLEQARIQSLEQFQQAFEALVRQYIEPFGYLVVFVDDLDRCLPEKAVEVLEAIKLFLDVPGCIFILGIDEEVIQRGIRLRYREMGHLSEQMRAQGEDLIDGRRYLEKIIQIPFRLPPIDRKAMGSLISKIARDLPHPECGPTFAVGLEPNPRQVKRAINIFTLLWGLSRNKAGLSSHIQPVRLAKMVVLQQRHPTLYGLLRDNAELLPKWEAWLRRANEARLAQESEAQRPVSWHTWFYQAIQTSTDDPAPAWGEIWRDRPTDLQPENGDYDHMVALAELLTMHPLTGELSQGANFVDMPPEEVRGYVFLTRTIEESVGSPAPEASKSVKPESETTAARGKRIETGITENRKGYVAESAFAEFKQFTSRQYVRKADSRALLRDLALAGNNFYQQIYLELERRQALALELAEPGLLRVSDAPGEFELLWELIYDGVLAGYDYVQQYSQKHAALPEDTAVEPAGFWGFKHVIERLPDPMRDKADMPPRLISRARVVVALGADYPQEKERADARLQEWANGGRIDLVSVTTLEALRDAVLNQQADIIIVRSRAYLERGELFIDIPAEKGGNVDVNALRSLLNARFSMEELSGFAGEFGVEAAHLFPLLKGGGVETREFIAHFRRTNQLEALVEQIEKRYPDRLDPGLRSSVLLTRQELETWPAQTNSALLLLDIDKGIGRHDKWRNWLQLFSNVGFAGVIAPMLDPHPNWSQDFMERFLDLLLEGRAIGESLRDARQRFFAEVGNPLGLLYAHFGPADFRLVADAVQEAI